MTQSNQIKADADVKRALKLFQGKVISDQERDTYINALHQQRRMSKPGKPRSDRPR